MIHIAGPPVQADTLVVQRCALCGCRLKFEYHSEVRNSKSFVEVYETGEVVYIETVQGEADIVKLPMFGPLELPHPNHHVLASMGGLLCTEVNEDNFEGVGGSFYTEEAPYAYEAGSDEDLDLDLDFEEDDAEEW